MGERKSIHHGLATDGHGPDEQGLGAIASLKDPTLRQSLAARFAA